MKRVGIQGWLLASLACGILLLAGLTLTLGYYFSEPGPVAALPAAGGVSAGSGRTSAAGGTGGEPAAEATTSSQNAEFVLVALGDSLTRGTGDPGRNGYVGVMQDLLETALGRPVEVRNFGVDGLRSDGLSEQLEQEEVLSAVRGASLLALSIGGNDLFQSGAALQEFGMTDTSSAQEPFNRRLEQILDKLRAENEQAAILLVGLYDPFQQLSDGAETSRLVRTWNHAAAETAARVERTVFVPTFDLFQLRTRDLLSADLFHPNAAGYRLIGERMAALVTE